MIDLKLIVINYRGGIISPGDLMYVLLAAQKAGVTSVQFGLRQQIFLQITPGNFEWMSQELQKLQIDFQTDLEDRPNIISSYPAAEIFINSGWLSEGVYKDIFDGFDFYPRLKVNICDSKQSFTPMLTGNINWVADPAIPHYWSCLIRFPRTNTIYESGYQVYTNDLPKMSLQLEKIILDRRQDYFLAGKPDGDLLFAALTTSNFLLKPAVQKVELPMYNLPYYEGLNRYGNKYWLGIYRRDESFSLDFLIEACQLCLETKIGQLCATPWKSIIVKGIEEKDRQLWNTLMNKYQVNVRHAANELNFQVEDNCEAGLALKHYLVKALNDADVRTFGICFGIKTRRKSEVFSSILVQRKPWFTIAGVGFFFTYDILCADEFNPNKRTGFIFSSGNPKWLLPEQVRRAVMLYYHQRKVNPSRPIEKQLFSEVKTDQTVVLQCQDCLSVYEEAAIPLTGLPDEYCCLVCESPKSRFMPVSQSKLGIIPV